MRHLFLDDLRRHELLRRISSSIYHKVLSGRTKGAHVLCASVSWAFVSEPLLVKESRYNI